MQFKQWLEVIEPEFYQQAKNMVKLGQNYEGDPYPEGGEFTELAAAIQGTKPAAIVRSFSPKNDFGLLQKIIMSGTIPRKDLTYQYIPNMKGWMAVGGEKEVRELVNLLQQQSQIDVVCPLGPATNCTEFHKKIGRLLGYRDKEVETFIKQAKKVASDSASPWREKIPAYLV